MERDSPVAYSGNVAKVIAAVSDLLFRSKIQETARQQGREILFLREAGEVLALAGTADLLLIDLDCDALHPIDTVRRIRQASQVSILGFCSHVHVELRKEAQAAGCTEVMARSQFTKRLPEILAPQPVGCTLPPSPQPSDAHLAAREGAAFRRSERSWIRVTGRDRLRWLQGMLTQEIRTLLPGMGCFAAFCNRQGKMVAPVTVRAFEDHFLLGTEPDLEQPILHHLQPMIIMDQVRLEVLSSKFSVIRTFGPKVAGLLGLPLLPWFHFASWEGGFASGDRSRDIEGFALVLPPETAAAIESRLRASGAIALDPAADETLRIEAGFPKWGQDMGPDDLPVEAGLEPIAVSYAKGCYLGQEVLQRLKTYSSPPRQLVHLESDAPQADFRGATLMSGADSVGQVTSCAFSHHHGRTLALARVRRDFAAPDAKLELLAPGGYRVSARVRALPWHRHAVPPPPFGTKADSLIRKL